MRKILAAFIFLVSIASHASAGDHFLVVQRCMLGGKFQYEQIGSASHLLLIKTAQMDEFQAARIKKHASCRGFMDVSQSWGAFARQNKNGAARFLQRYLEQDANDMSRLYRIQYRPQVEAELKKIEPARIQASLSVLTAFPDRDANSENGVRTASWIRDDVKEMIKTYARKDVSVYEVPTMNKAKQSSVIVKIGSHLTGPGIIIGSHMDTLDSEHEYKPGADDDASGVATLLETARVILSSHQQFKKPLYLVWYAGEEEGKLGSQSVVQDFRRRNIPVAAVMQLDMTGFASKNGMGIGLTDDYTDTGLTAYLADLVTNYVKLPVGAVTCGYACSDHVSWYQNGTPVAYPFETMDDVGNPHVDTRNDTVEKLSVSHIADFVKLSVAFAIELAEPV